MATPDTTLPVLVIAGPTASGKSQLALEIAGRVDATLINADSMQVYRELRILTARPSVEDEAKAPHALYGVMSAAEPCSAGHWSRLAKEAIDAARAAGRMPILVGGTGLYLKAATEGLDEIPDVPGDVRQGVRALHQKLGQEAFFELLRSKDSVMAERLSPTDPQRTVRAMEVLEATGRSLSEWQKQSSGVPIAEPRRVIQMDPERDALYEACDRRVPKMLEEGALQEVADLVELGLDPALPAMKALGVQPIARHLSGEFDLAEAIRQTQQATRNYAKRQLTWFRGQLKPDHIVNGYDPFAQFSERFLEKIFSKIQI